jgi:NitT/TauT family transport system substrate-binding protein
MAQESSKQSIGKVWVYALAGALGGVALLAVGYAWMSRKAPAPPAGPLEPVTIANIMYGGACPVLAAQQEGYFKNEGVAVTVQAFTSGKAALDAVFRGQAQLGTTGDIPTMFAVMAGKPAAVVATIATAENDLGIIGRKDRGITSGASLKGKRVGVTLGTNGHFVLDAFLNQQLLTPDQVTARNLKPEQMVDALLNGDVDAVSTWQPLLGTLQAKLGRNGTVFPSQGLYDVSFNLVGARDYVRSHPETIKKILRALIHAGQFCMEAPDAARVIVARGTKTNAQSLKDLWPAYRFKVQLDQSLLVALEDESRWAIKNKLTDKADIPNYLDHLYLDALEAVAPTAVTVIH